MPRNWIILLASGLIGLFGMAALVYGLAKVASAEERKPLSNVQMPNEELVALAPPDPAMRQFGFKACGVGGICLFGAAIGLVIGMRSKSRA